ncbi:hypothetical protein I3760_15G088900 [Carya illinoinensis]|nr:hypothetical protein I3760_15G088900 [Carya illinoinensis]
MPGCLLHLPLEACTTTFNLEKAVCNHGCFMMAPNSWIPSTQILQRPLRLSNFSTSVVVSISHPPGNASIIVEVHNTDNVSPEDEKIILEQVARMLRISERDETDLREFQNLHPEAKEKGFGRSFRSPTIFEDAIKSILLCNCTWKRSLDMAKALCELQSQLANGLISMECEDLNKKSLHKGSKRKRVTEKLTEDKKCAEDCSDSQMLNGKNTTSLGNFPSSRELVSLDEYFLKKHCNLGYRAKRILQLAKRVESGKLDLQKFEKESNSVSAQEVYAKLKRVKGFGPFACANLMMCMGFYEMVPMDSETRRHLQQVLASIISLPSYMWIYNEVFDLVEDYEKKFGKLSELPSSSYHIVTSTRSDSGEPFLQRRHT